MKITDKNKPTITELRTSVAQRLDACVKGTGDLEALKADELKRSGECAAIEASLEYDEAKGIQALETKKAQLELLRKRIASLEGSCSVHLDKLNGFMSGVHEVTGLRTRCSEGNWPLFLMRRIIAGRKAITARPCQRESIG
jgi:hypothetical protein